MGGRRLTFLFFFAIGVCAGPPAVAESLLALDSDTQTATAGYYQLRWASGDIETQLVESTDPDFSDRRVIYKGPDTARLVSGKPDGDYYYRLESTAPAAGSGPVVVSRTLMVSVRHHSLLRAWTFFAIGAIVFAATLGLIFVGNRDERR